MGSMDMQTIDDLFGNFMRNCMFNLALFQANLIGRDFWSRWKPQKSIIETTNA